MSNWRELEAAMRVVRAITIGLGWLALALCAAGVIGSLWFAPPADLYRISGISLSGGNAARIPYRGMDCSLDPADPLVTICGATVRDQPLRVTVEHEARPGWGFRRCEATWGGATTSCRGFNVVTPGPPYAIIDGAALGMTANDLRATAWRWPTENWGEAGWLRAPFVLAALAALGVALLASTIPTTTLGGRVALAGMGGVTTFLVALVPLGLLIASLGVID